MTAENHLRLDETYSMAGSWLGVIEYCFFTKIKCFLSGLSKGFALGRSTFCKLDDNMPQWEAKCPKYNGINFAGVSLKVTCTRLNQENRVFHLLVQYEENRLFLPRRQHSSYPIVAVIEP